MSAGDNLSTDQFHWLPTKDREGARNEVLNTEVGPYIVHGGGARPMPWTVHYPGSATEKSYGDYGMTDTKREARAWAEDDVTNRRRRASQ